MPNLEISNFQFEADELISVSILKNWNYVVLVELYCIKCNNLGLIVVEQLNNQCQFTSRWSDVSAV